MHLCTRYGKEVGAWTHCAKRPRVRYAPVGRVTRWLRRPTRSRIPRSVSAWCAAALATSPTRIRVPACTTSAASIPTIILRIGSAATARHPFLVLLRAPPGGRLLDFGCGAGGLLQQLHRLGWHVTGLDVSPRMVRHVRDRLGLPAFEGTLPHPDLTPGSFDAITMAESLEHVHDPLGVLRGP